MPGFAKVFFLYRASACACRGGLALFLLSCLSTCLYAKNIHFQLKKRGYMMHFEELNYIEPV
jgi:hypothetical protein